MAREIVVYPDLRDAVLTGTMRFEPALDANRADSAGFFGRRWHPLIAR